LILSQTALKIRWTTAHAWVMLPHHGNNNHSPGCATAVHLPGYRRCNRESVVLARFDDAVVFLASIHRAALVVVGLA
jgi:hypothetical protein